MVTFRLDLKSGAYHEVVSSSTGSDSSALGVHAPDHVDEVDVRILLAVGHVPERSLGPIVLVLKLNGMRTSKAIYTIVNTSSCCEAAGSKLSDSKDFSQWNIC